MKQLEQLRERLICLKNLPQSEFKSVAEQLLPIVLSAEGEITQFKNDYIKKQDDEFQESFMKKCDAGVITYFTIGDKQYQLEFKTSK